MNIDLGRVIPIYRKAYSDEAAYELNDIVLYEDGNLYWHCSATPTTGVPPTDDTVWAAAFAGDDLRQYVADAAAAAQQAREAIQTEGQTQVENVKVAADEIASKAAQIDQNAADIRLLSEEKVARSALSLGFGTDGKLYIMISGVPIGSGVEINGTIEPSEGVVVFAADFSGLVPSTAQFYSWEGRIYDNAVYDALENIQCSDGVAVLTSVYDSANSRWIKQMMCTGGLFESDNFICTFKAKFSSLAGSWQNVITYGTGTHWTNGTYSDGIKWPVGGEIDVFEQAGGYAETPTTFKTPTAHYGSGTNSGYPDTHQSVSVDPVSFTTDEWHNFKFSLKNGYVKVWIDDVLVGENDFSDCLVSNNYVADYKPFLKPQAFYIEGGCASGNDAIDTSNIYRFEVSDFKVTQDAYVECTGLEIYPQMWPQGTELIFPVGAELYLDRVYIPENTSNKACTWVSSDPSVATVEQGYVKVLAEGTTTITATCGTASAQYILTAATEASVPCAKLSLSSESIVIAEGSSEDITPYIYPRFSTDPIIWATSDPGVITVDGGTIKAVAAGFATVTAMCGDNQVSVSVTVNEATTPYISYDFSMLYAYINQLLNDDNQSVTIKNTGSLGDSADLLMTAVTGTYYDDGTYEPNGVVKYYSFNRSDLEIPLKGHPFLMLYKGVDYAKRKINRWTAPLTLSINGTNTMIAPSLQCANGVYKIRYGDGSSTQQVEANGNIKNIVVYSDGIKSYVYAQGEKIIDGDVIDYIAETVSSFIGSYIDEQIDGVELYIGKQFTESELIAMSVAE